MSRPPLPMPAGFGQGEDVWRSLTRRQQEAILDDLSEPPPPGEPSPGDRPATRRSRPKKTRRRAPGPARRAGRVRADVDRGVRRATAPAHSAVASGAQLVVWLLLVIGLYHALRYPEAFTGTVDGVTRFVSWLTAPRGIPAPSVPAQQGA